jgi:Spy/CpxP family protein refolding chaperone
MFHRCYRWSSRYAYAQSGQGQPGQSTFYQARGRRGGHHGGGSSFGVRRPLRYLAYQLDLDDRQTRRIAAVLDRLKVEREQARLDEARTVIDIASLVTQPDISVDTLKDALAPRVSSAEHLQVTVAKAMYDIISELDPEQREDFAYLLNSKAFVL